MSKPLPIRWRLTVWYSVLLGVMLLLFALGLYFTLRLRLYDSFDEQLQNQAAVTLAAVTTVNNVPTLSRSGISDQEGEYFIRLLGPRGEVIADTGQSLDGVPLDADLINAVLSGETRFSSSSTEDGNDLRIVTVPVRNEEAVTGALQIGLQRNEINETLNQLIRIFAFAGPLMLLIAVTGGYFLAGRVLKPVATITELAGRISEQDLDARLNLDLPDDELGQLTRTFDTMLGRIEEAFDRQRRFTADAAHELRTPLALMRGQIDVILARPRTREEYRAALWEQIGDLERLTALVGTLLTLSRADTGRLVPNKEAFDLAETVALVLEQYIPIAAPAGVELRNESERCPCLADEDLLVQVLVNLLDNALAHTPDGGTVAVGCKLAGTEVHLWVADTGSGIPLEHQASVFDRFYRVDAGRGSARGGTGLGLAICKAIADAHGGSIQLTSVPGSGTRVMLALPVSSSGPHLLPD